MRKSTAVLTLLLLAACSRESAAPDGPSVTQRILRESPEKVLGKYLDGLYRGPARASYEYVTSADRAAMPVEEFEKDASMGQLFTSQATYVVKEVKVEGPVANATVDVTMPDVGLGALAALSAAASGDKDAAAKAAADATKNAPKVTRTQRFTLRLENEGWRVDTGWAAAKQKKEQAAAAAKAYLPNLQLSGIEVRDGFMGPYIAGELKNLGDKTLTRVAMKAYLLGADGNPIAEDDFTPVLVTKYSDAKPLKPGYVEKLHHSIDAPKEWSRKVRVEITSVEFEDAAAKE